jgi:hypothetical protein
MRRTKLQVIRARLVQAQLAIHRQSNFRRVLVFLPVVFPPANGAQLQGARRFKRPISATRATITDFNSSAHVRTDARVAATDYKTPGAIRHRNGFFMMPFLPAVNAIPKISVMRGRSMRQFA